MAANITDADLSDLKRLSKAASPGPWEVEHTKGDVECYAVVHATGDVCAESEEDPGDFDQDVRDSIEADFAVIAAAWEAVPKLVAEVRRLRRHAD
jgi:hypothetical protein